jgi:hypothetical protein
MCHLCLWGQRDKRDKTGHQGVWILDFFRFQRALAAFLKSPAVAWPTGLLPWRDHQPREGRCGSDTDGTYGTFDC